MKNMQNWWMGKKPASCCDYRVQHKYFCLQPTHYLIKQT